MGFLLPADRPLPVEEGGRQAPMDLCTWPSGANSLVLGEIKVDEDRGGLPGPVGAFPLYER